MVKSPYFRLSLLQFLQYFVLGSWFVTGGTYLLETLQFTGREVGLIYGGMAIAATLSPFIIGTLADRLLVNRTVRPLGVSEAALGQIDDPIVQDAGRLHRGLYENQKRWRKALPEHHNLPFLFGEHDPFRIADRLSTQVMA